MFNDAGASCVAIMGLDSAARCPSSWKSTPACTDKTPGPLTNQYPAFITVNNNMMNHFGRFEKQPAGVALSRTECDTIRHNTIHDCPRAGICLCDGCWGGHIVEYNWVYNTVLETGDHGPFNAWGRDRNSRWANDSSAARLDAWLTTVVRNNKMKTVPMNFGIDLDDQSSNYSCYNNVLIGVGSKLQQAHFDSFRNNIIVSGGTSEIHHILDSSGFVFAHNIVVGPDVYEISGSMTAGWAPADIKRKMVLLDSNVLYSFGKTPNICPVYQRGTVYCTWAQWQAGGLDVHSIVGDPLFTDSANGDYTVKAGSPALTMGFKNFPMDSFGVMPVLPVGVQSYPDIPSHSTSAGSYLRFAYTAGHITISHEGQYAVSISNALGRTIAVFGGKGTSSFTLAAQSLGAGVYFAAIRTTSGLQTRRFVVGE